jgi:Asp-tRNA(Asn)/Glu-tRNA(Gln) amidotransferase A subunit family amidase
LSVFIQPAPLITTAAALRSGQLDLVDYVEQICGRVEALDPQLKALLPEPDRLVRLRREALALQARFPDPARRPLLYGVLVGVKDVFRVDGFLTRAGSQVPADRLAGAEAACVSLLKSQGALMLGKTATAEFAYIDPGPTHNPHNLDHTPGGSSSGSAAAVAAGFCALALGTQTMGSTIRPAAYCGIIGFKPSYGRIPTDGVILVSRSLDHVGLFTQDVAGLALAASVLCKAWRAFPDRRSGGARPVLGIPTGPYLEQASSLALESFTTQVARLEKAGYAVRRITALEDIKIINEQARRLMASEAAEAHANWFSEFEPVYGARIAGLIREGQRVVPEERLAARTLQHTVRAALEGLMKVSQIDLWISPATTGPAPSGLDSTGSPAMNIPWTVAGLPAIALPAGTTADGLPLGIQCAGAFMADEQLLRWNQHIADALGYSLP